MSSLLVSCDAVIGVVAVHAISTVPRVERNANCVASPTGRSLRSPDNPASKTMQQE
jgi:hypothetical protein